VSQSGSQARKKPELSIVFMLPARSRSLCPSICHSPTNQSLLLHYLDSKKQGGREPGHRLPHSRVWDTGDAFCRCFETKPLGDSVLHVIFSGRKGDAFHVLRRQSHVKDEPFYVSQRNWTGRGVICHTSDSALRLCGMSMLWSWDK
jgi:hypothetical protein